ncbi:MAG TPA: hypothetical protein VGP04_12975 [Pseudonocardiaceae bacterium]|nr:hypothetical protein [Pseudonocardiaceae bacterium]
MRPLPSGSVAGLVAVHDLMIPVTGRVVFTASGEPGYPLTGIPRDVAHVDAVRVVTTTISAAAVAE